jgi:hypothetical protein
MRVFSSSTDLEQAHRGVFSVSTLYWPDRWFFCMTKGGRTVREFRCIYNQVGAPNKLVILFSVGIHSLELQAGTARHGAFFDVMSYLFTDTHNITITEHKSTAICICFWWSLGMCWADCNVTLLDLTRFFSAT